MFGALWTAGGFRGAAPCRPPMRGGGGVLSTGSRSPSGPSLLLTLPDPALRESDESAGETVAGPPFSGSGSRRRPPLLGVREATAGSRPWDCVSSQVGAPGL